MSERVAELYLEDMRKQLRGLKTLADRALAQVKDGELHVLHLGQPPIREGLQAP